ncbi:MULTISPECIES: 3-deoxy-7-phosphoheptulonate synthase [Streptomyces]|uniref:Phospho-2-dehydro-3-deoxyheptonate aldolase n=1 Tax=Streptomyces albus subsp. chlorinus TaxID=337066 RepID=A0A3G4YJF7_9ACTN|nr:MULTISPECIES: 3-deoxy-7-phosphoheptulonate synthase [Streptomyces]UZN59890.1 DAHP synthase [Streptomyces albus subsp. chlorinus] [Streptomyces sp. GBA 94-10 4N24]WAE20003.1 DAHP synthase [Streptomyces albus subsp. chlorinus] [Streptomyces albidoflavus]AYV61407.1 DAHP synthase [Streptomyces albus subsp. chlorinus]NSC25056.1 3-deoxy-7-phosphoheptulonate synthase [Streptomyces albus subsp. chlorinus]UZN60200.1 DAHP synthase [Streptomyces albus subsp. chlorinus] [Streptomyces sp. GBA 94-10 4N24
MLPIPLEKARQQPEWEDRAQVQRARETLAERPGLVRPDDVRTLRAHLALVSEGAAQVVQAGDCAEDPAECTADHVARKVAVLDLLAGAMKLAGRRPVLRVGRIAGQFAKPRSQPTERVGDGELPVYRGHLVNGPAPDAEERRPDPLRLVTGYMAAADIIAHLGQGRATGIDQPVWTSHEALVLDYEVPLVRRTDEGELLLSSAHWPWLGERTRQVDGPHAALLAQVVNPVAVKVGPTVEVAELLALCALLDPERRPGRLTLIVRMGAGTVAERLPALVRAVRSAGHPVVWLTDPMHGNTVVTRSGHKTRYVRTLQREVREFRAVLAGAGAFPGGVHLETTPDQVTECVLDAWEADRVPEVYTSFCDPRLTVDQALEVLSAWGGAEPPAMAAEVAGPRQAAGG